MEKDSPGVLYASVNPEYMNSNEGNLIIYNKFNIYQSNDIVKN